MADMQRRLLLKVQAEAAARPSLHTRARREVLRFVRATAKDLLLGIALPLVYRWAARRSVVAGRAIFLESKEPSLPDSFQLMWSRLLEVPGMSVEFLSLGEGRVRLRQYYKNSVAAVREVATAQYVFLNDASNVISCLPLRSETRVVQLWHGCGAFKKWGMSTADLIFGGSRKDLLRHPFYKNLFLVTVSSPEVVWAYEEAMVLQDEPGVVKPLGVSRTDVFFDKAFLEAARLKVESVVPRAVGRKMLLYAPTFRGRVASATAPDALDIAAMERMLGDAFVLLIKHHPFVKDRPLVPASCDNFAFDVTEELSINDLLCCADMCISDYSSLVFEYSLFERPMLFFAFDKDEYEDWRGFFYDYDELTPGPVCETTRELIERIVDFDKEFDPSVVRDFRKKFMSSCDGHSTERVIDYVLSGNSSAGEAS